MKKLEIVQFEEQNIQLYSQDNEILMSKEELAKAIGFNTETSFRNFLADNPELYNEEFSFLRKVKNLEGGVVKNREKRFFNEQGIYEAALLARTEKAKKFRKFARVLITKFHRKEMFLATPEVTSAKVKIMDEKLDKIEAILIERQEVFEKMEDDSEKEIKLLEKLEEKIKALDKVEERLKAIEDKVLTMMHKINKIMDELEM